MNKVQEKVIGLFAWMVLIRGALLLIFGILMFSAPASTVLSLIYLMGFYWVVDGILSLIEGFFGHEKEGRAWLLITGFFSVVAGIFIMGHPLVGLVIKGTLIVYLIGFATIASGLMKIFAKNKKGTKTFLGMLLGSFHILFGIFVITHPVGTISTLAWLLALGSVVFGVVTLGTGVLLLKSKNKIQA